MECQPNYQHIHPSNDLRSANQPRYRFASTNNPAEQGRAEQGNRHSSVTSTRRCPSLTTSAPKKSKLEFPKGNQRDRKMATIT